MAATIRADRVLGVFDRESDAEAAVADLLAAGFPHDRIEMISPAEGSDEAWPRARQETGAASGAATGAAVGAGAGVVAGAVAAALVPGAGPALFGALALGGAALGAAGGGYLGPFLAMELSEAEATHYSRQVEAGRTVLVVHHAERKDEACMILERHGCHPGNPYDV